MGSIDYIGFLLSVRDNYLHSMYGRRMFGNETLIAGAYIRADSFSYNADTFVKLEVLHFAKRLTIRVSLSSPVQVHDSYMRILDFLDIDEFSVGVIGINEENESAKYLKALEGLIAIDKQC